MSGTYETTMGDRGRLVIPVEVLERAGLAPGSSVILVDTPHGIVLMRREQLRELVRAELQDVNLVNELLAARHGRPPPRTPLERPRPDRRRRPLRQIR